MGRRLLRARPTAGGWVGAARPARVAGGCAHLVCGDCTGRAVDTQPTELSAAAADRSLPPSRRGPGGRPPRGGRGGGV
eukprot:scaffold274_cov384-Prasinococcus_capsulatus_cf.AAC.8